MYSNFKYQYLVYPIGDQQVNEIRREMFLNMETLAPHHIVIHKNQTEIHDEMLKERIGNVVFHSDHLSTWKGKDHFRIQGRGNYLLSYVSLDELVADVQNDARSIPVCKQKNINIVPLIAPLKNGEQLDVEFDLAKGTGQMHNKWCSVCAVVCLTQDFYIASKTQLINMSNGEQLIHRLEEDCPYAVVNFDSEKKQFKNQTVDACMCCSQCKSYISESMLPFFKKVTGRVIKIEPVGNLNGDSFLSFIKQTIVNKNFFENKIKVEFY